MGFLDRLFGKRPEPRPPADAGPPADLASLGDEKFLDALSDLAFRKLVEVDEDLARLDEPFRTVAIVYSAQGVIDNGGLRYFFENDWPRKPPYALFADAYERIGRTEAAQAIRAAAASFGIEHPERHREARLAYLDGRPNETTPEVEGWDDCICGDDQVWADLASWARNHHKGSDSANE